MYHYWFIDCNKCTTAMQDVNNRGNFGVCAGVCIWEFSVLPAQVLCKPKTALTKCLE